MPTDHTNNINYANQAPYRKLENLHIVFWLLKDISWCLLWKPLGITMILPTLLIAMFITWQNRSIFSEFMHNLAIICWIIANSYWMISEFFQFETKTFWGYFQYKHLAVVPFAAGLILLAYFYLFRRTSAE